MTKPSVLIAPSVLASDFACLADETKKIINGGADWVHLDIMDGHFVPNISFGAPIIKCLRTHVPRPAFFDCHLMVSEPEKWIEDIAKAGGSQFTFHLEAVNNDCDAATALAQKIKEHGMEAGISIKPGTPFDKVIKALDSGLFYTLLVMTVEPGFGGQKFMADMMPKVKEARERYPTMNVQVDGGLDEPNSKIAGANGANIIVAGTSVFKAQDTGAMISAMRKAVGK